MEINLVDVPTKYAIIIVFIEKKQTKIMQRKQEVGWFNFAQYKQQATGSGAFTLNSFNLCEPHVYLRSLLSGRSLGIGVL